MTESTEAFRLSPQQHRLWRLDPEGRSHLLQARAVLEITGPVEAERLRAALRRLAARHETLRTGFRAQPGFKVPFQILYEERDVDWRQGASGAPLTPDQVYAGSLHASFEPSDEVSRLHLALPSPCLDAPGWAHLVRELAALYAGEGTAGGEADLVAEPLQYVDYAEWQLDLLESEDATAVAGREFWQTVDLPALATVRLPMEFEASDAGARTSGDIRNATRDGVEQKLDAALLAGVEGLAERLEIPPAAIWLSCWRWLLGRHLRRTGDSAEPGVVVRFDGRGFDELEGALGAFARWLPLSAMTRDGGGATLRAEDYLRRTAIALEQLDQNQPFFAWPAAHETLVPAFGFEHDDAPVAAAAGEVSFRLADRQVEGERTRLTLSVFGRYLRLSYFPDAFDRQDVERLATEVVVLVSSLLAAPEQPMLHLVYLSPSEREQVVDTFNARAGRAPSSGALVPARILDAAATHPDRVAVVFENTSISYGSLDRLSALLASRLRALTAGTRDAATGQACIDQPVALCLERSAQLPVAMLGILRTGAAYAPLDPEQPIRRLTTMLEDLASGEGESRVAPILVTDRTTPEVLKESARATLYLDDLAAAAARGEMPDSAEVEASSMDDLPPASLAYVIFTSGSTGRPKGVAVSHGALEHYVRGASSAMDLPAGATYATVSTFGADLGHTSIFPALCTGGTLHVLSRDRAADAAAFADYFERRAIECLKIVPSHLQAIHESADGRRVLPHRRLVVGGEASERDWLQQLAASAEGCRVFNHYGPSEATVGSLVCAVDPGTSLDRRCATVPIGRPLPESYVVLLDAQGQPVPAWVPGEIHIGGSGLARGYLGRPALTAEVFVPDALSGAAGGRLYRTGDLARHVGGPGGEGVEFLGRVDHQVKFHGFRIELEELREVLNQHDGVRNSVVRLLQDQHGHDVLVAYYVARHELESADLRATLAEEIPEETLPNVFVHLRKLPLTLNGKVNVEALPSLAEVRERMEKAFVPPRNDNETQLAEIWKEVLGVPRVGINDNFFELGGHSLLATRVISRMRQRFSVEVPLRALFEVPTVAGLVEAMDARRFNAVEKDELDDLQPGSRLELEDQLAELEAMSDEEAEAALKRESILD